jgi:acetylornithine deacetylase/succinyl-diaminopimelate desuccinylase-like protein
MEKYKPIDDYIDSHLGESISELSQLCSQPSVAAQNWGLEECAELVKEMLSSRGFESQIIHTAGAPVVFAERKGQHDKTLLFYNHYDVQPPEPLELWNSPPFQPALDDGKLFARGVSDDKGHLVSRLFAIDALLKVFGDLPCNIKFVIEGEEEIGSVHLTDFIRDHTKLLRADACIWEFGSVDHRGIPMQYLGLRGICYVELTVRTAKSDVHSGLGGSIFPNSAWRLVWALSSLKDQNEHIQLPGHYTKVQPPSKRDIQLLEALPEVAHEYQAMYGVDHFLKGLQGGTELRINEVFEPTCTICGLTSGYQGKGSKTVLPAQASAKIDFRLVPDQTPEDVLKALRNHLDAEGFSDVEISFLGGGPPCRTDPDDPFVSLVVDTAAPVYGQPMQIVPITGGSGPNYAFKQYLDVPICTAGIGYPGSNTHAPNENILLDLYLKGAKHITRIIDAFANH